MNYTKKDVTEFLKHSNLIEEVYSDVALEDAEKAWAYIAKLKNITIKDVLHVHKLLMKRIAPNIAGRFRQCDVWIGGYRKMYISDGLFKTELTAQLDWLNNSIEGKDIRAHNIRIEVVIDAHVRFEEVHPFQDGNGRTGRILYNWHRLQLGLPIHIIHEGEEQYKYYSWFKGNK